MGRDEQASMDISHLGIQQDKSSSAGFKCEDSVHAHAMLKMRRQTWVPKSLFNFAADNIV